MSKDDDGFGIVETVIAMGISFLVITVMLNVMLASSRQMQTRIYFEQEVNDSDSMLSVIAASWDDAQYDTVLADDTHILYQAHDDGCYSLTTNGDTVEYRAWKVGDTAPVSPSLALPSVTSLTLAPSEDTLTVSWAVKRAASAPTVHGDRVFVSTFDPASRPPVLDAFGVAVDPQPAPTNACGTAFAP